MGTDCCGWDGVTCDTMTGHVIGLDLTCSRLEGPIHPNSTLFSLRHLQRLNLAYNNIYGSISSKFGGFANMTHLNLTESSVADDSNADKNHSTERQAIPILTLRGFAKLIPERRSLERLIQGLFHVLLLFLLPLEMALC